LGVRTELFDFDLPPERIALRPASPRDAARLLVVNPATRPEWRDHVVRELPDLLRPGDARTNVGRVQDRSETGLKDEPVIRELFAQFSNLQALESHVVDSGLGSPQHVAEAVRDGLSTGRFRLGT